MQGLAWVNPLTRPVPVALRMLKLHANACLRLVSIWDCIRWQESGGVGGLPPTVALFVGPAIKHPV